jgi:hypothetical protein
MSYTRGPWTITKNGCVQYPVDDHTGIQTWVPCNKHWPGDCDDPYLIAAAPDLLEACKVVAGKLAKLSSSFPYDADITEWERTLRAAIARVESPEDEERRSFH